MEYNLEDLEEIKDLDRMEEYKDVKKFVVFKDKGGKSHLLPFINNLIIIDEEIKIGCKNVDCFRSDLHCLQCPFTHHGKLSSGEFKILKPKEKKLEEKWKIKDIRESIKRHRKLIRKVYKNRIE